MDWLNDILTRIIPVPTGNAGLIVLPAILLADHPRAYGERLGLHARPKPASGSSPCLRGTLARMVVGGLVNRIIPVPTGNAP